ncbi:MAG TPA: MFS transporter [Verrucomicrobiae bacterium]|nr:MFS transporter [Verrucomicrobiae bacterium]
MNFIDRFRSLTPRQRHTFFACYLGWSLDAFDFFILVVCLPAIAAEFHSKVSAVSEAISLTLALRPVGAFLFGILADRFGRRRVLMLDIISFSLLELASGFAPSLKVFLILRALFGVAMGGEWGVGAALTFETLPAEGRGLFSGLLQVGYNTGYLLAGLAFGTLFSHIGWRMMFVVGALPAFLVLYIRSSVEESPAWESGRAHREKARGETRGLFYYSQKLRSLLPLIAPFLFLAVLMFGFNLFSHGTQDLYPTFLIKNHGLTPHIVGLITVIFNVGALLGSIVFGAWSEKIGRRRAIIVAVLLTIPVIPLWAYSTKPWMLAVGAFILQFLVEGAWGIVPAHLNELSPASVRGTFPGFAYQLGNFLASWNAPIQAKLAERRYAGNFAPVLAWTALIVAAFLAVVTFFGKEATGADLSSTQAEDRIPAGG